jgi:hypothetical protein
MGTELGNLCSLLCIFVLHVSILTHAPPSPPLLTFGTRHNHGCGRVYTCSPPGGTQCPPFAAHVTVINTTTTTTSASFTHSHTLSLDSYCKPTTCKSSSPAGLSTLVCVYVVDCASASPNAYSSSTHRFPDERTPIEGMPLSSTSAELGLGLGLESLARWLARRGSHAR